MNSAWFSEATWDDPNAVSHNTRCNLVRFTEAARDLRDSLNEEEFQVSSNKDIINLVKSPRYAARLWWRYLDPAASRSKGEVESTAIVLWQCSAHVLTCRIVKKRWVLLPGYVVDDIVDVLEFASSTLVTTIKSNSREVVQIPDDDDLEEVVEFNEAFENEIPSIATADTLFEEFELNPESDFDEEDTELSLLKIDRELEKEDPKFESQSEVVPETDKAERKSSDQILSVLSENHQLQLRIRELSTELSRTQRLLSVEMKINANLREMLDIHREDRL